MANSYLIDIGLNDSIQDVIRKCNKNFRKLSSDQSKNSRDSVRREADRADQNLDNAMEEINVVLENAIEQINILVDQKMEELNGKIDEINYLMDELETSMSIISGKIPLIVYKKDGIESQSDVPYYPSLQLSVNFPKRNGYDLVVVPWLSTTGNAVIDMRNDKYVTYSVSQTIDGEGITRSIFNIMYKTDSFIPVTARCIGIYQKSQT